MMHFLQLETSWHCAALWVVVPSAPPIGCSNSMYIIKLLQFFIFIHPKIHPLFALGSCRHKNKESVEAIPFIH